jgi:hypothetical protein
MPKKTKIIFIVVFILVGVIVLGLYWYLNRNKTNTPDTTTNIIQKFNPFGTSSKITNPVITDPTKPNPITEEPTTQAPRFQKITNFAVAGATFFEDTRLLPKKETTRETTTPENTVTGTTTSKTTTTKTATPPEPTTEIVPSLRYVERATGHVYQMYLDTKVEGKISNSTIPAVYETIFDETASSIIYRYFSQESKTITSFLAVLGGKSSSFLSADILQVSLSPDKTSFFSLIKSGEGVIGVTRSFGLAKTTQVFTSPFTEWLPQWAKEKNIFLTTKPSYLAEGSIFSLDITNGTLTKIFGEVKGLTTLANKDGTVLLFGASLDIGPKLNIFNIKGHTSFDLGAYGLPEKCVWAGDNINIYCAVPNTVMGTQFPDAWYQGLVSFDDYFVKIDTVSKEIFTLANSIEETPVDGTNLFLDKTENNLFFINKKDGTLWSLDI